MADSSQINAEEFQSVPNVNEASFAPAAGPVVDSPSERLGLEMASTKADVFPELTVSTISWECPTRYGACS